MNTTKHCFRLSMPALALLLSPLNPQLSTCLAQGPLTPPGAPAPTMKTLDQLDAKLEHRTPISALPFTISSRGSYYVTGNLTGVAGQHGITIDADHVTVDLAGFDLAGAGGAATNGIRVINSHADTTIRNGSVHGWTGTGVAAETNGVYGMVVEDLRVTGNGAGGILLGTHGTALRCDASNNSGGHGIATSTICKVSECTASGNLGATSDGINVNSFCLVRDCLAMDNGANGIEASNGCVLTGCVAENDAGAGFKCNAPGCTVRDCTASSCGTVGFSGSSRSAFTNCAANFNTTGGFSLGVECTLANCSAAVNLGSGFVVGVSSALDNCSSASNAGVGFSASDAAILHNCTAAGNTGNGFIAFLASTLSNCSAEDNGGAFGISTSSGCTLIGCTVRGSTSSAASSAGISASTDCFISQCVVSTITSTAAFTPTTGMGITVGGASTVERCTVQGCKGDGIRATSSCFISGNTCDRNGDSTGDGAGIHTTGIENRIEGNSVTGNDRGIEVTGTRSLVIKNSAATNTTDYVIAASNRYGPIVNITAAGAAAVSGNSAADTSGTTHPWANFSY